MTRTIRGPAWPHLPMRRGRGRLLTVRRVLRRMGMALNSPLRTTVSAIEESQPCRGPARLSPASWTPRAPPRVIRLSRRGAAARCGDGAAASCRCPDVPDSTRRCRWAGALVCLRALPPLHRRPCRHRYTTSCSPRDWFRHRGHERVRLASSSRL